MAEHHFEVESESELLPVAQALLPMTKDSRVVCFMGPLGAGKTTLIKVFCNLVGVLDEMSSPTYALVNEYKAQNNPVFHFDFYRINDESEAFDMGYEEYFFSGYLCLVEWPEKISNLIPDNAVKVSIEIERGKRIIKLFG